MIAHLLNKSGPTIFLFHGVANSLSYRIRNYNRKHVEACYFAALMTELRNVGTPLSMAEVKEHYLSGEPFPPYSFAITFDDGFENNLTVAAPILHELSIPATFYITTGFVENNRMSWIDSIEAAIEDFEPSQLRLPWEEEPRTLSTRLAEIALLQEVRRVGKQRGFKRKTLFESLEEQLERPLPRSGNAQIDQKLTWSGVKELAAESLFIIGGHTHTHPNLADLDQSELECELDTSIGRLSELLGAAIEHYAYPEGLAHCYSHRVISALTHRGISCCPTAIAGPNPDNGNPDFLFHLRRYLIT